MLHVLGHCVRGFLALLGNEAVTTWVGSGLTSTYFYLAFSWALFIHFRPFYGFDWNNPHISEAQSISRFSFCSCVSAAERSLQACTIACNLFVRAKKDCLLNCRLRARRPFYLLHITSRIEFTSRMWSICQSSAGMYIV